MVLVYSFLCRFTSYHCFICKYHTTVDNVYVILYWNYGFIKTINDMMMLSFFVTTSTKSLTKEYRTIYILFGCTVRADETP